MVPVVVPLIWWLDVTGAAVPRTAICDSTRLPLESRVLVAPLPESILALVKPPARSAPPLVPTPSTTLFWAPVPLWQFRHNAGWACFKRRSALAVWARWQLAHWSAPSVETAVVALFGPSTMGGGPASACAEPMPPIGNMGMLPTPRKG